VLVFSQLANNLLAACLFAGTLHETVSAKGGISEYSLHYEVGVFAMKVTKLYIVADYNSSYKVDGELLT
jgi:hypothetical protein